jgi:hypothetical protein
VREQLRDLASQILNTMHRSDTSLKFRHTNRRKWLNRFVQLPVGKEFFAIEQDIDVDAFATIIRIAYEQRNQYTQSADELVSQAHEALELCHSLLKDAPETATREIRACAAVVRQSELLISYLTSKQK